MDGRRWRASDPGLPDDVRTALVGELMAARRAVGAADAATAERRARDRVHDAKVALGERGHPWWEDDQRRDRLAAALRSLARRAGVGPVQLATAAQVLPDGRGDAASCPRWCTTSPPTWWPAARSLAADGGEAVAIRP